jgi:hypothetical protein
MEPLELRGLFHAGDLDLFYGGGGISSHFGNYGRQEHDIVAHQVVALTDGRAYVGGKFGWDLRLGRLDSAPSPRACWRARIASRGNQTGDSRRS